MGQKVAGYCPMGCGDTLFLGSGGYVTCSLDVCPYPDAVSNILDDRETEHVVDLGDSVFTVRHPLRERLDDDLMRCKLHERIASLSGPPRRPGRYRVSPHANSWTWVALNDPA